MEKQVLTLAGAELTFSDLVRSQRSAVRIDPELVKTLQTLPSQLAPVQLYSSKVFFGILLSHYLRSSSGVSLDVAQKLESLFTEPAISLDLPESVNLLACQETYKLVAELVPTLEALQELVPIFDGLLGLSMESLNLDSGLINEDLFSLASQGLASTLGNLQSLLHDSKLAKKNSPTSEIIEALQTSAALKDLLVESEKIIEKEVNCVSISLKKTVIRRSSSTLTRLLFEISSILGSLASFLNEPEVILLQSSAKRFEDLHPTLAKVQETAINLLRKSKESLLKRFQDLVDFDNKINQGAAKPRPLQLGKGSRGLYNYLKENIANDEELASLSGFVAGLLAAKNEERRVPKIAKGMRDYAKEEMNIRQYVFTVIRDVFQKHMADELDTPVMELRETLTGKYGEEGGKLIYDIADQGGELLSLRYDLTVPFARYVAINRISNWKRFQIGKVYRRDQPQMKKGRYREFYQCDFDIVGTGATMSQEIEILKIVVEILTRLEFNFSIKINHRKLLDSILDVSGVPTDKFRTVSSSIDKLDKEDWCKVRQELIDDKGISAESADKIGEYVKLNGNPSEVLARLREMDQISNHKVAKPVLQELDKLASYAQCMSIENFLNLDMSLARGLDYYTGLVYEAVIIDGSVGSIAGGGRYDELISRLNNSNQPTPAVGVSLGVERLFTVIEERYKAAKANPVEGKQESIQSLVKSREKCVLVAQAGGSDRFNLMLERLKLCNLLWNNGIKAETSYKEKSDPKGQAGYASQEGIRWIVWVGDAELAEGKVKVKDLNSHSEEVVLVNDVAGFILSH